MSALSDVTSAYFTIDPPAPQPPQQPTPVASASVCPRAQVKLCMPPAVPVPKPGPCKGTKRGARKIADTAKKAAKKAAKKTTGASAKPKGRKGKGPGSGRDLSHLLNLEKIADLPRRTTLGDDARLGAIAKEQGFDAKADVVDAATLDAAIADGAKELWRAVKPNAGMSAQDIHDRAATGPAYFGRGIYGNGMYYSNDAGLAAAYAEEVFNPAASMRRSALHKDARTITYPQLLEQMARDTTTSSEKYQQRAAQLLERVGKARNAADLRFAWEAYQGNPYEASPQDLLRTDPGAWAMSRGYDAIIVPIMPDEDDDQEEIVVLNRGALLTERNPERTGQRAGVRAGVSASAGNAGGTLVQACMPPRSPVPKPGPCKGIGRGKKAGQKIRKAAGVAAPARAPARAPSRRRPDEVRTSLMLAETVSEVNETAETEARRITGRSIPFDLGGEDADIAREHAEGILQGLERFPGARLRTVGTFDSRSEAWAGQGLNDAFAITTTGPYSSSILFNRRYIDDAAHYRLVLSRQTGHLVVPSPIGIGWHEFGHVIGNDTEAATESKKIARSMAASQGTKTSAFVQDQISDYSKKSIHELLAEGFADVMAKGTEASAVSLAIMAEVERRYEARQNPRGRR